MTFLTDDFLLTNDVSKELYAIAKEMPIFDYHCHLNPQEIFEDKPFEDIVDIWLKGDHYKWRLMRANGIPESKITGDASAFDKFEAFVETVSMAVGNPLFHWSHLELKEVFGVDDYLTKENSQEIFQKLNKFIKDNELSPRKLIKHANVKFIGTTDHPLDDLKWHKKIAEDTSFDVTVAPTFRPDEAFVEHTNFAKFIEGLEESTNISINSFAEFMTAMEIRIKYFCQMGCKASDISFTQITFVEFTEDELNEILSKALNKQKLTDEEMIKWQTGVFTSLCQLYKQYGLVTQVHFGALRNNNSKYSSTLGPDTGFDSMGDQINLGYHLNKLLNYLAVNDQLPKMIWYNLNPQYNTILANNLANYQANEEGIKNMMQFGAAWWFADTKEGMLDQMSTLAQNGMLANFTGMLTDSRSFLSYQRHDYFRRILAEYIGNKVKNGEIPNDKNLLSQLMQNISYYNAVHYFE